MDSLVSIIIPTYNRAEFISETLDSILAQTYDFWECIIIDDNSFDETDKIVSSYQKKESRFVYIKKTKEFVKGPSVSRNIGIRKSKGKFVMFLDSDDLLHEDCLKERVLFSSRFSENDFWIFQMETFGKKNTTKYVYGKEPLPHEHSVMKLFKQGYHPFVISCPLWKRSILVELNGFDESLVILEDPDLHLRALKRRMKHKFYKNNKPDCYYRLGHKKSKPNFEKMLNAVLIFVDKHYDKSDKSDYLFYIKRVYKNIIFKEISYKYHYMFVKFGLKKHFMSFNHFILGYLILVYHFFRLNKQSKFGYHSLLSIFNKFTL